MNGVSPRQVEVYEFIKKYIEENKYPPTYKEIGAKLMVHGSFVMQIVKALVKKGYMTMRPGEARTLRIVKEMEDGDR